ncbi:DUF1850 domain-containing protein [Lentibacillus amyloliquefaciens]|uniref:DUF1850 domain-containing protein n=1 Tax=Lentibacillus amyloliquefaciens TaxID=1472767 RepID=A0A0U4F406_9BACI|nr:DUF1850 domain-containing protein [Lentibacillus amyloliquefaciens]ALX50247.1 hypothetical protein AOX59_17680 [Lentibacillus amyloliquefaciens]
MFRKYKAVFSLALLILILIGVMFIPVKALTVLKGDEEIYALYLKDRSFSIQWTHSVEKEDWIEYFNIRDDVLYLESTKFKTFGAGVPSQTEHSAVLEDGWVHMDIERKIGEALVVRSHQLNDYQLRFGKETYDLQPSDDAYTISVSETPLHSILFTFLKRIVR